MHILEPVVPFPNAIFQDEDKIFHMLDSFHRVRKVAVLHTVQRSRKGAHAI
jgi:hypothetical protein